MPRSVPIVQRYSALFAGIWAGCAALSGAHAMEVDAPSIQIVLTARDSAARLTPLPGVTPMRIEEAPALSQAATIAIDPTREFQTIVGFGGAFTEAAAYTLQRMKSELREAALRAYFDPSTGLGYTLCRTHINSCDFSLGNYAYNDIPDDLALTHFDIARDRRWLIPMIKDAQEIAHGEIRILASPWSPPAWMKTNGEMNHGGKLKASCRPAWALYFAKHIEAYAAEGIPIWGVTVQNEPAATQVWDSCTYSAEEERIFVRDHLGPTLERRGHGEVRIIVWDHNKEAIYERAAPILSDPEAAKYVWGVGFHWYTGDHFDQLARVHDAFPNANLLFTEGCQEGGLHLHDWSVGERYGHDIIGDLNNWTVGWIDWNLVLDERGGPNHVDNLCDAPIIADTLRQQLYYENSYYYLGHFSKYIRPGAVRIGCTSSLEALEATAFRNRDGKIAIVVMNRTDAALDFRLLIEDCEARVPSPAHSIMTLLQDAR